MMKDFSFIYLSLKSRWLNVLLSILLTAFGVSIALLITQFGNNVQDRLRKDGEGIDIVVGAKGSPLQLILSSVYHIDIPTGNIRFDDAQKLIKHPQIKNAIPLALGDNWKGHRIVGTSIDYLNHYKAKLKEGRVWKDDLEVVVGSSVKLKINDKITGAHGLYDGGRLHENIKYKVVGIIKPTQTVLDRLILTSINSVLEIHGLEHIDDANHNSTHEEHDHDHHKKEEEHNDHLETDHHGAKNSSQEKNENNHYKKEDRYFGKSNGDQNQKTESSEITALLLTTNSPIANINLPRYINKETTFQAANPAIEITRLTSIFGLGSKSFKIFSFILIIIAALTIFSGLAGNLENRMVDLAILRALGYTKNRIFKIILLEGMMIIIFGLITGIILGLTIFQILNNLITPLNTMKVSFSFNYDFLFIISIVIFSGVVATILPAYRASKISVVKQLSRNI